MVNRALPWQAVSSLFLSLLVWGGEWAAAQAPTPSGEQGSVIYKVRGANEKLEMTVNTSRILTLDQDIPQVQVNNPNLVTPTILSPRQVQISAKAPGCTQVNLWDAQKNVYTVDVVIYADAQELSMLLRTQFPNASLRVIPVSAGVLISGYVDQPEQVGRIVQIAEEFYPKVLNNITVGGVQQVLLHVKVMEVSRTKLRSFGFDWAQASGPNIIRSSASGLLTGLSRAPETGFYSLTTSGAETVFLSVLSGSDAFFAVLEALRRDNLMKVLAEPTLVTVSGRPAQFQVGGSFPILVPQSLGTVAIEYKDYGTQVDFVPIVLGNGHIRLEVRPWVSEVDNARSVSLQGYTVPGLRQRRVDTAVELLAGQTLAIAGLVQTRSEASRRGIPWVSDVPYLGALFRRVSEESNEIETLVMVTPELVEGMNASQVPPCGPGERTTSPNDWELYMRGYIEVPKCCPPGSPGTACPPGGAAMVPPGGPVPGTIEGGTPEVLKTPSPTASPTPVVPPAPPRGPESRPGLPPRAPAAGPQNPAKPQKPADGAAPGPRTGAMPSFMGPIGYDAGQ